MAEKAVNFIMDTAESADIEDEEETKTPETVPTKTTPRRPSAQSKTSKKDKKVSKTKKNAEKKEENKKKQEVTEEKPAEQPTAETKQALDIDSIKTKIEERYNITMEKDEDGDLSYKTKKGKIAIRIGTYKFKEKEGVQFYGLTIDTKNAGEGIPCDTEEEVIRALDSRIDYIKTSKRRK